MTRGDPELEGGNEIDDGAAVPDPEPPPPRNAQQRHARARAEAGGDMVKSAVSRMIRVRDAIESGGIDMTDKTLLQGAEELAQVAKDAVQAKEDALDHIETLYALAMTADPELPKETEIDELPYINKLKEFVKTHGRSLT